MLTLIHESTGLPVKPGDTIYMHHDPNVHTSADFEFIVQSIFDPKVAIYCDSPEGYTREYRADQFMGVAIVNCQK